MRNPHTHLQRSADTLVCVIRALLASLALLLPATASAADPLEWSKLKPLPDEHGFAGPFAGVSDGALIVAGGANFPNGFPWDGGAKAWHDSIFILEKPDGDWKKSEAKLPRPLAYGVSASTKNATYFIGGQDAEKSYAEVYRIFYDSSGKIEVRDYDEPDLPTPTSMACAAVVNNQIYIAGGSSDAGKTAQKAFYRRSYTEDDMPFWEPLPWPENAPARILAVAGSIGGKFYMFGGADLGSDKWDKRTYLNDAYEFNPKTDTWRRLADLPQQLTAGPSPAIPSGQSHLLLIGGANREFADAQRALRPETNGNGIDHPGFPKKIFAYHTITDTWVEAGTVPEGSWSPVTTPTLQWNGRTIIPTGEIKPGIRSPQILTTKPTPAKRDLGLINWIIVAVYLGGMVLIGYLFSKRNRSTDDYFRGGQRIPSWVAGLSIFATMLSAITFTAIPARAYATDATWYIGQIPVLIVVPIVIVFYLPFFRRLNITSAYEFLEQRFNLAARLFASASFILYHIGRVAIVLYLPAIGLAAVSSIDVIPCIVIIGILCVIYTVMGGIEAVVWTDAIQAIVLLGGALLCLVLVFLKIDGGIGAVWETSINDAKLFSNLTADFDIKNGTTSFVVLFIAFLFNALVPYTSSQDVVQRYVTTPTEEDAARSLKTTMWMSIFGSMIFFGLGLALYAFYKSHSADLDPAMGKTDAILPFFILQQLPVGIAGLIIAAIFAAAQSTVSSSLNSIATAYVTDFHARVFKPGNPDEKNLTVARIVVVVIGTVGIATACLMAKADIQSAFELFQNIIGVTAGSLGGLFALGIFNKRANGSGAVVGAIVGFATVLGLYQLSRLGLDLVSGLLFATVGFLTCFIVGSLASLLFSNDKPKQP